MRFLSRSLLFDLALGAVAALIARVGSGAIRTAALILLFLCIVWVPWDLATERRRGH